MAARMRVSSSTARSLMGTLKSTRTKTRLPLRLRSRMESFGISGLNDLWDFGLWPLFPSFRITRGYKNDPRNNTKPDEQKIEGPKIKDQDLKPFPSNVRNQVSHAARIAPLVVVA